MECQNSVILGMYLNKLIYVLKLLYLNYLLHIKTNQFPCGNSKKCKCIGNQKFTGNVYGNKSI